MPILKRLTGLYERRGILISTGLNPCHFGNLPSAAFTWFIKDGESLTNGLGIAMQEVYFLECLFARLKPKSIFIIGNSGRTTGRKDQNWRSASVMPLVRTGTAPPPGQ